MHTIHIQTELSPRATVLACAEGLLGELVKYARMGFNDMMTEIPLHATVQLIAAVRGYHHHHEYPVNRTKNNGDYERLDFVFSRSGAGTSDSGQTMRIFDSVFPVEMKVVGRSSKNYGRPWKDGQLTDSNLRKCYDIDNELKKIKLFCNTARSEYGHDSMIGYLLVVNMDIDSGIRWDVEKAGGVKPHNVHFIQRYFYSSGNIQKSVTVYEVCVDTNLE